MNCPCCGVENFLTFKAPICSKCSSTACEGCFDLQARLQVSKEAFIKIRREAVNEREHGTPEDACYNIEIWADKAFEAIADINGPLYPSRAKLSRMTDVLCAADELIAVAKDQPAGWMLREMDRLANVVRVLKETP